MGFYLVGVMDGSEDAIKEAATLGNNKLEEEEQDEDELDVDDEDEDKSDDEDHIDEFAVIRELEKGSDASAPDPLMLAAAAKIKQLGEKTWACLPKRENAVEMYNNLAWLYHLSRNYDIEYISNAFGTREHRAVLLEAERVGNDKLWY
jgi:hypothetical protein